MATRFKASAVLFGFFSIAYLGQAQCDQWQWPGDGEARATAEEKNVLYTDALSQHRYIDAIAPLNWLLTHTPNLNKSLYINGAEIYDNLAEQEKDAVKKQAYIDSLMLMYDRRLKNCGEEAYVTNRKALAAFKHNINSSNADKVKEVLALFDKAFELNKSAVLDITLVPYMQTVMINELKFNNLTDEQILQRYDLLVEVIDTKLKTADAKTGERLKSDKEKIDDMLLKVVKVDCEFVNTNLKPKFKKDPTDLILGQKIFQFMMIANCIEDPFWLEVGEAIYKGGKKDYGLAINLGRRYYGAENFEKARSYFKEAGDQATNPQDKATALTYLGQMEARRGNKPGARDYYRQALAAEPGNKDAYEKIGDLYYSSYEDCLTKETMAQDRLVFIAAYEMYQKAGNSQKMAQAQAQFPSIEDIFTANWQEGETKPVGCWVGERVVVRKRPQE